MERIFSGYIKAHGYAIAVAALTFGCIFAADVSLVEEELRPLDVDDVVVDHSQTFFRVRPMGQLMFSLIWVLVGTIFLVGIVFEKKETILPFATIFSIDFSLFLIQQLTQLERRNFKELVLSSNTAVLVVIPVYVGFTLVVLYRLFDRSSDDPDEDQDDVESARKPVKFTLGDEFDDSWIS
ncbi:uncharacterized protein LOC119770475 [Culex quinquefasciatus]|uniref:uncharacterized protein LOC119770475 n=1 Tax=Culex quinquefasciatus TaxID=7176 RepID=UPI0018E30D0C|nr:uncharacterized protein LOC119770475 [Culex quinquefasciatus]